MHRLQPSDIRQASFAHSNILCQFIVQTSQRFYRQRPNSFKAKAKVKARPFRVTQGQGQAESSTHIERKMKLEASGRVVTNWNSL